MNRISRHLIDPRGWLLVTLVTISLTAAIGFAQNVHLKPPNRAPSFIDLGLQLQALGNLAGLGQEDILILLTADADVTATCTNPAGATQPPGQNPAPITVTGAQAIPADEVKNGNVSFNVLTALPTNPIPGAPDCPNPQWTETITDLVFTEATITVQQPPGTPVFTVTCTLSGTSGSLTASNCQSTAL
jgi:hypothetical protein